MKPSERLATAAANTEPDVRPGLDVGDVEPCASCGKPLMEGGGICFYEVTITQHVFDLRSIQQMHGMEMMMGGNVPLARIFSPSTEVSKRIGDGKHALLCQDCGAINFGPVALFLEESE